jgi:glycosyltransferase involved in cell wall biosynthesis
VRICLVFEHSLAFYTRILQEIDALREAGAVIELLTSHPRPENAPAGIARTYAPLWSVTPLLESTHRLRPVRIASNIVRNAIRPRVHRYREKRSTRVRESALREIAARTDIFWVVDEPSLPTVARAARRTGAKVVYETLDLVPEYLDAGEDVRTKRLADERRLVGGVDGFITVCDSYADYYMEMYGGRELRRRPLVRNDMPATIVDTAKPTSRPLRLLFLGSLMHDRPVAELIRAMALVTADITLTFQGVNHIGEEPADLIDGLGLHDRVLLVGPCPPDSIVDAARDYDIGIVALRGIDENERRASTTKSFTYMSAGLALLGSDLPGIARVIDAHRNGVLVAGMEPEAWAEAIDRIAALPDSNIDAMRERSLAAARVYAWEKQRPTYVAEFARALEKGRSS